MAVLTACVAVCVMVTVTPGSTAPLVSVTRPLSSAVDNCADAAPAVRRMISAPKMTFPGNRLIRPPLVPLCDSVLVVFLTDVFEQLVAGQPREPRLELHVK